MSEVCEGLEVKSCTWCTFRNPSRADCPNLELVALEVYEVEVAKEFPPLTPVEDLRPFIEGGPVVVDSAGATHFIQASQEELYADIQGLAEDVAEAYGSLSQDEAVRTASTTYCKGFWPGNSGGNRGRARAVREEVRHQIVR